MMRGAKQRLEKINSYNEILDPLSKDENVRLLKPPHSKVLTFKNKNSGLLYIILVTDLSKNRFSIFNRIEPCYNVIKGTKYFVSL